MRIIITVKGKEYCGRKDNFKTVHEAVDSFRLKKAIYTLEQANGRTLVLFEEQLKSPDVVVEVIE